MDIGGFQSTTLLDYPEHLACTVFTRGCNMRCPFCQNGSLVIKELFGSVYDEDEIIKRIEKRKNILEGVCISGGEPTLQPDLIPFIKTIRSFDLKIKLDTNGTSPSILGRLLNEKLIDYVAMDLKSSFGAYHRLSGLKKESPLIDNVKASVLLLMKSDIPHEFRTTVINELHDAEDIEELACSIKGEKAYYIQPYVETGDVIGLHLKEPVHFSAPSNEKLNEMLKAARKYIPNAMIRGLDLQGS